LNGCFCYATNFRSPRHGGHALKFIQRFVQTLLEMALDIDLDRRRAALLAMGRKHKLTLNQLAALRACDTSFGPKVWQLDEIEELISMGLVERVLGGFKVTIEGKATLAVDRRSI
jgi:hypothetical protein